jgi:biotin-dependent carboxylase-like uncharacterized protein
LSMIEVIDGGLQTIVVDLGRYGWYWQGLPPSGPMDYFSFVIGNILLGNDDNAAGLECCYGGVTFKATVDTCVAFTGAEVSPTINNKLVAMWQAHQLKSGDVISFRRPKLGRWSYLCFSGGIDVPLVYGSRTTYLPGHLGGYEGRALCKGDFLRLLPPVSYFAKVAGTCLEDKYVPSFSDYCQVRVVFGLLHHLVSNMDKFSESTWELSTKDTRIAYRFYSQEFVYQWLRQECGEPQHFGSGKDQCNTILVPYPVGSIQTDMRNGAIVVFQDAVSVGGFVTVGTVIQCDQDLLAQTRPSNTVKFIPISRERALGVRKEKYALLNQIRESCLRL